MRNAGDQGQEYRIASVGGDGRGVEPPGWWWGRALRETSSVKQNSEGEPVEDGEWGGLGDGELGGRKGHSRQRERHVLKPGGMREGSLFRGLQGAQCGQNQGVWRPHQHSWFNAPCTELEAKELPGQGV